LDEFENCKQRVRRFAEIKNERECKEKSYVIS